MAESIGEDGIVDCSSDSEKEIKMLETLFQNRFTEEDEIYMERKNKEPPPQPTFTPWHVQSKLLKRGWDWSRRNSSNDRRRWDRNRHYSDFNERSDRDRDRSRNSERDRDRGRDSDRDRSRNSDRDRNHHRSRSYRDLDDPYSRSSDHR